MSSLSERRRELLVVAVALAGLAVGGPSWVQAESAVRAGAGAELVAGGSWAELRESSGTGVTARLRESSGEYLVVVNGPTVTDRLSVLVRPSASAGRSDVDHLALEPRLQASAALPKNLMLAAAERATPLSAAGGGLPSAAVTDRHLAAAVRSVESSQAPVLDLLERKGATVVSTYSSVLNGMLIRASAEEIEALRRSDLIAAVVPAPVVRPALAEAVPLIGARAVIDNLGFDGAGANIAIVDTGVDYTHAAFGGPGTEMAYSENSPGVVEPGSFPTAKVVGGYDLAGELYAAGRQPNPDDDPLDRHGHGTHVAGIAAGLPYTGGASGVAPGASLVALKIFGQGPSTSLIVDAIEWAVDANLGLPVPGTAARVDVMNLSVGSPWSDDILSQVGVVRRAADAGVVVIASAGNEGNVGFVTGSPAAAPDAVSVASTHAGGARVDMIRVLGGQAPEDIEAIEGDPALVVRIGVAGEVRALAAWMGRGCIGDTVVQPVANRIAVIERGKCTFHEKLNHARVLGAIAAVVVTDDRPLTVMGTDQGNTGLPAFMIGRTAGLQLRDVLLSGSTREVVMSPQFKGALQQAGLTDVVSGFSSRGPGRLGSVKPNLAAPGSSVVAPRVGSGNGRVGMSGTSMASPMAAGVAALAVERLRADGLAATGRLNPTDGLAARDVGMLLVGTADATAWSEDSRLGIPAPMALQGAGRVDAVAAATTPILLAPLDNLNSDPFAINLGLPAFSDVWHDSARFSVRNLSALPKRIQLSVAPQAGAKAGYTAVVVPGIVDVPAGGAVEARLAVTGTAAATGPYAAIGGDKAQRPAGLDPAELALLVLAQEIDGDDQPVGEVSARLPAFALPQPASRIQAPQSVAVHPDLASGSLALTNSSGLRGEARIFQAIADDDREPSLAPALDIDHVGMRVSGSGNARVLEVLVHTRGPRVSPIDVTATVALDVDRDGAIDKLLFNYDLGMWITSGSSSAPDGNQASVLADVAEQRPLTPEFDRALPSFFADVLPGGRSIVLRASVADLGIGPLEPVAFDAVVAIEPNFFDVAQGNPRRSDSAPDLGLVGGGVGSELLAVEFPAAVGLESADASVDGHDLQRVGVTAEAGGLPAALLVSVLTNAPAEDLARVQIVSGVPTATPSAGTPPTATPLATVTATGTDSTPTLTFTSTGTVTATLTGTPGSEATPTGAGTSETPGTSGTAGTPLTPETPATPVTATATLTGTALIEATLTAQAMTGTPAPTATPVAGDTPFPTPTGTPSPTQSTAPPNPTATSTPATLTPTRPRPVLIRRIYLPLALRPFATG